MNMCFSLWLRASGASDEDGRMMRFQLARHLRWQACHRARVAALVWRAFRVWRRSRDAPLHTQVLPPWPPLPRNLALQPSSTPALWRLEPSAQLCKLDESLDSLRGACRSLDAVAASATPAHPHALGDTRGSIGNTRGSIGDTRGSIGDTRGRQAADGHGLADAIPARSSTPPAAVDISNVTQARAGTGRYVQGPLGGLAHVLATAAGASGAGGGGSRRAPDDAKERTRRVILGMGGGFWIWLAVMLASVSLRALKMLWAAQCASWRQLSRARTSSAAACRQALLAALLCSVLSSRRARARAASMGRWLMMHLWAAASSTRQQHRLAPSPASTPHSRSSSSSSLPDVAEAVQRPACGP